MLSVRAQLVLPTGHRHTVLCLFAILHTQCCWFHCSVRLTHFLHNTTRGSRDFALVVEHIIDHNENVDVNRLHLCTTFAKGGLRARYECSASYYFWGLCIFFRRYSRHWSLSRVNRANAPTAWKECSKIKYWGKKKTSIWYVGTKRILKSFTRRN